MGELSGIGEVWWGAKRYRGGLVGDRVGWRFLLKMAIAINIY